MSSILVKIQNRLKKALHAMEDTAWLYASNSGHDFTRNRKIPLSSLVRALLVMSGGPTSAEILNMFPCKTEPPSRSAFCKARDKLLPEAGYVLLRQFNEDFKFERTYKGYHLLAGDGSDLALSYNPADPDTFVPGASGAKGSNHLHANVLLDVLDGRFVDVRLQLPGEKDECRAAEDMTDRLGVLLWKIIYLFDRGYEGYNLMAHIDRSSKKYVIRAKDIASNGILSGLKLPKTGEFDIIVDKRITRKQTNEVKQHPELYHFLPANSRYDFLDDGDEYDRLTYRVVRIDLGNGSYECLLTNLSARQFSLDDLKALYHLRWGVETAFDRLKNTCGLESFHSKKRNFVIQEIYFKMLLHNLGMIVAMGSEKSSTDGIQCSCKVSRTQAIAYVRKYLSPDARKAPPYVHGTLQKQKVPVRNGRSYLRDIKAKRPESFLHRAI